MTNGDHSTPLSPTVVQVIGEFITAMRSDDGIENDAIDRLEVLLKQGTIPKADDINAALFDPLPDGGT